MAHFMHVSLVGIPPSCLRQSSCSISYKAFPISTWRFLEAWLKAWLKYFGGIACSLLELIKSSTMSL